MKKIICLIFTILFYILGIIGLIIPIVPQIPFFIIGTIFLIIGFKEVKEKVLKSEFYDIHLKKVVEKNRVLKEIFKTELEENNK